MRKRIFIISAIILTIASAIVLAIGQIKNVQIRGALPVAEAVYEDGRKVIFLDNHKIKFICEKDGEIDSEPSSEATWWLDNGVLVYFTGEGTSYYTIIDGYEYEGRYDSSDGMCYHEVWIGNSQDGSLEDVGYVPIPAKGTKLENFTWLKNVGQSFEPREKLHSQTAEPHKLSVVAYNGITDPLPSHKTSTYGADRLIDNNPQTGWAIPFTPAENMDSPIWGPNIELQENSIIDYVIIYNGYCKNSQLHQKNYRSAWITIYRPVAPDTGYPEPADILYDGPLEDTMKPQRLPVNKEFDFSIPVKHLRIKLPSYTPKDYYSGNAYNHLVISEIEFWGH